DPQQASHRQRAAEQEREGEVADDEAGVAQETAAPGEPVPPRPHIRPQAEARRHRDDDWRSDEPREQRDRREGAEPNGVERAGRRYGGHVASAADLTPSFMRARAGHACTAQNGAHWCWVSLSVPTCTQHCTRRSSNMVSRSMNGLMVIRLIRSAKKRRILSRSPSSASRASRSRVARPRSQFSQMLRNSSEIAGCVSELCSLSSPRKDCLTSSRSCAGISWSAMRLLTSSRCCFSRSCPTMATSERQEPLS